MINERSEEAGAWERIEQLEHEARAWRDVAVLHGAEVQADHDYMARAFVPISRANDELIEIAGRLGDEKRDLKSRLASSEAECVKLEGQLRYAVERAGSALAQLAASEAERVRLETALRRTHDVLDDLNANASSAMCLWCHEKGYDGDGLKHKDDCVLVAAREALTTKGDLQGG